MTYNVSIAFTGMIRGKRARGKRLWTGYHLLVGNNGRWM